MHSSRCHHQRVSVSPRRVDQFHSFVINHTIMVIALTLTESCISFCEHSSSAMVHEQHNALIALTSRFYHQIIFTKVGNHLTTIVVRQLSSTNRNSVICHHRSHKVHTGCCNLVFQVIHPSRINQSHRFVIHHTIKFVALTLTNSYINHLFSQLYHM